MIYGNSIEPKQVKEIMLTLRTDNFDSERFDLLHKDDTMFTINFKQRYAQHSKGDFWFNVDFERMSTRVVFLSRHSKYEDDWTRKEWKLSEMTSKEWRTISDKIKGAHRHINNEKKFLVNEFSLSLDFSKHDGNEWKTIL